MKGGEGESGEKGKWEREGRWKDRKRGENGKMRISDE